jgi:hypothetical protein
VNFDGNLGFRQSGCEAGRTTSSLEFAGGYQPGSESQPRGLTATLHRARRGSVWVGDLEPGRVVKSPNLFYKTAALPIELGRRHWEGSGTPFALIAEGEAHRPT